MPWLMLAPHAAVLTCLLIAALAAGCGDDETLRIDRPIVRFELDEYRIAPQDVTVRPGRLKIEARNVGRAPHNLVVQTEEEVDGETEWVDVPGAKLKTIRPGRRGIPVKTTLKPGTYRIVCTIANHDDLGQYGEMHVEDPSVEE